jgi:hypothetical protein
MTRRLLNGAVAAAVPRSARGLWLHSAVAAVGQRLPWLGWRSFRAVSAEGTLYVFYHSDTQRPPEWPWQWRRDEEVVRFLLVDPADLSLPGLGWRRLVVGMEQTGGRTCGRRCEVFWRSWRESPP